MTIRSRICNLLGIEYPIFQGGMIHIATWELSSAVSNAGGLGIIGSGNSSPEWIREQIKKTRDATSKPFAVNILLISPYAKEIVDLVITERIPVVTIAAGIPRREIPRLKDAGIKVIPLVGTKRFAELCEEWGADAVIAEGMESGGEIGDLTTIVLVPQVVDSVSIPVIAAGGFADGRGLVTALALGAEGIQLGTRFIASEECIAHINMKKAIVDADDRKTVVCGSSVGPPMRALSNKLTKGFLKLEREFLVLDDVEMKEKKRREIIGFGIGATRKGLIEGDIEYGSLLAGQISGMIKDIKPVKQIINDIMSNAEDIIRNMPKIILEKHKTQKEKRKIK